MSIVKGLSLMKFYYKFVEFIVILILFLIIPISLSILSLLFVFIAHFNYFLHIINAIIISPITSFNLSIIAIVIGIYTTLYSIRHSYLSECMRDIQRLRFTSHVLSFNYLINYILRAATVHDIEFYANYINSRSKSISLIIDDIKTLIEFMRLSKNTVKN